MLGDSRFWIYKLRKCSPKLHRRMMRSTLTLRFPLDPKGKNQFGILNIFLLNQGIGNGLTGRTSFYGGFPPAWKSGTFFLEVSILVRLEPQSLVQWTWMRKRAVATLPGQVDLSNPGTGKSQQYLKWMEWMIYKHFRLKCKDFVLHHHHHHHHHPTELANHLYKMVGPSASLWNDGENPWHPRIKQLAPPASVTAKPTLTPAEVWMSWQIGDILLMVQKS